MVNDGGVYPQIVLVKEGQIEDQFPFEKDKGNINKPPDEARLIGEIPGTIEMGAVLPDSDIHLEFGKMFVFYIEEVSLASKYSTEKA